MVARGEGFCWELGVEVWIRWEEEEVGGGLVEVRVVSCKKD